MAGLIQQSMQPGAASQVPQGADGAGPDPESDPVFNQAMEFAMQALYKNGAAKEIANTLASAPDIVEALANTAYEICSITDEKTNGQIPDELLALFATNILQEVADIGEAAGIEIKPSDAAAALKQMILRFVAEQGGDTTQLQAEMDKVDPSQFDHDEQGEMPDEAMEAPGAQGVPA